MKFGRIFVAIGGLAIGAYLVFEQGYGEVFGALQIAGWRGLGAITLFHVLPTVLCGIAWWVVVRPHADHGWPLFTWMRWIRDGIDGILPILPVSGELVATRILALRGVPFAGASIIVDLTAELLSQVLFSGLGLGLLIVTHPGAPHKAWIALGIGAMALQFTGFLLAQKKGLFRLIEHPLDWFRKSQREARSDADRTLHDRILTLYEHRWAFLGCILLHLVAWIAGGLEAWIGLQFMGHPLSVAEVLVIEGLVTAVRSLAFFVPLGAGVQEGGYVLIGGLVGLAPDLALALSLLKRGRDIALGVPALLVWQFVEGRELARQAGPDPATGSVRGNPDKDAGATPA